MVFCGRIYICVGEGGQSKTLALLYIIYVECFDCTSKKIADCKVIQKLDGDGHEEEVLCVGGQEGVDDRLIKNENG